MNNKKLIDIVISGGVEGGEIYFHDNTGDISFMYKGVMIRCNVPKYWDSTKIFQFMENLFNKFNT